MNEAPTYPELRASDLGIEVWELRGYYGKYYPTDEDFCPVCDYRLDKCQGCGTDERVRDLR